MESHLILVFISTVLVTVVLGQGVYLEFDGKSIPNNSVVDYNDITTIATTGVGSDLRCVTERMDCCSPSNRTKAEWFTPNESPATTQWNVYRNEAGHNNQKGYISMSRKESTTLQEGLYYCNIIAVNGDISTFYVGIYTGNNSGRPTISGITYHKLNPEMFTLTCTSIGGPATNVTWTLNGSEITYDANHVLTQTVVNTITAEYNNTLTVTGREPGNYQCTVSNTRGSDTSQLLVVHNTGATAITPSPCLSSTRSSMTAKPSTTITTMLLLETPTSTTINENPFSSSHPTEIPKSTTTSDNQNPSNPTEKPASTTTNESPFSSSHPTEIPTSIATTASDNENPSSSSPPPEVLMTFTSTIVVSVMAAVLLVVTVVLSVVIVLLVLRQRHLSASLQKNPGIEMVDGPGAIPVEECVAYGPCSHGQQQTEDHEYETAILQELPAEGRRRGGGERGGRVGGGGGGGGGAIYSEPAYELGVVFENPAQGKVGLSSTTEETVYERLD